MVNRGELALVVLLVLGQLVFLAAQIQDPDNQDTLLDRAAMGVTAPAARAIDGLVRGGQETLLGLQDRRHLSEENDRLKAEIKRLQSSVAARQGAQLELRRLRESLGYEPPAETEVRVARVVYANHRALLRRLVVEVLDGRLGAAEEEQVLRAKAAVVTEEGLVGRIITSRPPYAKVQLVTDRSSSVGVMVERTRRQGLLRGAGDSLLLNYLPLQADVRVGDRVVTAGIDGIYPRGVLVGSVTSVRAGEELFHSVVVAPAVDFSRLDQVFLLASRTPPEDLMSGSVDFPLATSSAGSALGGGDEGDSPQ